MSRRSGFGFIGWLLAVLLTFSGLQLLESVAPVSPASAAVGVDCSASMTAQNGFRATPSHGPVFYIDSGVNPKIDAAYVGYKISSGSTTGEVWVSLSDFVGGKVSLANPADQYQQIQVTAGASSTVFFLLKATGASTAAQSHVVRVWDRRPDLNNAQDLMHCDYKFSKVQESIKANANKIGTVTKSAASPVLGGLVSITLGTSGSDKTQTGTLGSGSAPDFRAFWASPAGYSSWPTQALRLESTTISLDCGSTSLVLTDELYIADGASGTRLNNCIGTGNGGAWTATYNFRVIGPGPSALKPNPVAIISSGTQYKHSSFSDLTKIDNIDLSSVSAASAMTVGLTATRNTSISATNSVRIKYTAKVSTSSTVGLQVDEIVDKHNPLPAGFGYVSGTTTHRQVTSAGNLVANTAGSGPEPNVLAAEASQSPPPQHFIGPFTDIKASSAQELTYEFNIPCDGRNYVTTIYAYVGSVAITASASTASIITVSANSSCAETITPGTIAIDPTAVTSPATSIAATTATINAFTNSQGNLSTSYRFIYDTDPNLAYATSSTPTWTSIPLSPATTDARSSNLTGLTPLTTYYFRIQIKNSSGTIFSGTILSFTTLPQAAPVSVTTAAATNVLGTAVTLNGSVNPNLNAITTVKFTLCTDAALTVGCLAAINVKTANDTGASVDLTFDGTTAGDFAVTSDSISGSQAVTTLVSGTTYYFRLSAVCTSGTNCPGGQVNGAVFQFTTGSPTALTQAATLIGGTTATLNGTANAKTTSSTVSFCYSTSSAATNGILNTCNAGTASTSSISGSADQAETSAITGLAQGTTYYFQIKVAVASPSTIISYGGILQFTTLRIETASPLTQGTANTPYSASFSGIGGSNTYNWSAAPGALPDGLTLTTGGLLSGTPSSSGTYTFDITMTDPLSGLSVTKSFTLLITGAPTVANTGATNVRATSATINSTISPNGTTTLTTNGTTLCWGTDPSLATCTSIPVSITGWSTTGVNVASADLTGLTKNTDYYYKVTTTWSSAPSVSVSSSPTKFTTGYATTSAASNVSINGATLQGTLIAGTSDLSTAKVTSVELCYSTTNATSGGLLSNAQNCGTSLWTVSSSITKSTSGTFTRNLTALDPNATYWFQTKVTYNGNNSEVAYGDVLSFTTLNLPTATIDNAFQVSGKGAKIRGKVNPKGNTVGAVKFCLSLSSSITVPGSCINLTDVATSFITVSGSDNTTPDTAITGLQPRTQYYYLIYAKTNNFLAANLRFGRATLSSKFRPGAPAANFNAAVAPTSDTVYSSTTSFTTAGATTDAATSVGATTATLNGTLTASSAGIKAAEVSSVKLCYSTSNASTNSIMNDTTHCSSSLWGGTDLGQTEVKTYAQAVTGLTQGTQYYQQLQVVFADGTTLEGSILPFTTASLQVPTAVAADTITKNSAILRGSVDAKGTTLSSVQFCYDTTDAFTNCASHTYNLTAPTSGWTTGVNTISQAVTGLNSSTTYFFKVMTVSNLGSVESTSLNFKTLSVLSFDSNGGSAVDPISYATGSSVSLSGSTPIWIGHTFLGWFASGGTTAVAANYAVPGTTDQTLTAHWSLDVYNVYFDENFGSTVSDAT